MFKIQNDAATAQIAGIHKAEIDVERQELERLSDRLQRAEQREVDALKTLRKFEATCREMEAKLKSLKSAQDSAARIKVVVAAVIKHLIDAQQEINKLVNSFIQIETSLKKIAENAQAFKDNSSAAIKSGKAPTKNQSRVSIFITATESREANALLAHQFPAHDMCLSDAQHCSARTDLQLHAHRVCNTNAQYCGRSDRKGLL